MVNRANNTHSRISLLSDHPIAFLGLRCNALLSYTDAAFVGLAVDAVRNWHTQNE